MSALDTSGIVASAYVVIGHIEDGEFPRHSIDHKALIAVGVIFFFVAAIGSPAILAVTVAFAYFLYTALHRRLMASRHDNLDNAASSLRNRFNDGIDRLAEKTAKVTEKLVKKVEEDQRE